MIKIVSRDDCPYCEKAIQLLESKGETYEVLKLTTQEQVNLYRFLGFKTVPHVVGIGGYTELVKYYER